LGRVLNGAGVIDGEFVVKREANVDIGQVVSAEAKLRHGFAEFLLPFTFAVDPGPIQTGPVQKRD
jgi:hypothetical protein